VAKPKKIQAPSAEAASGQLANVETPGVKWTVVAQIGAALVGLWVFAFLLVPYLGYVGVGVVAVITAIAIGFAIYLYVLTRRSRRVVEILKSATDDASRKAAIAQLAEGKGNDALAALARAQLVARDDPKQAIEILEAIDLAKAGAMAEDEVRSNLAYLYLVHNRPKDARPLVDKLKLDRGPSAKVKAMYAAVTAETFARTGSATEAKKIVESYRADDPEIGELAPMLLRAQVFTFFATKNRGLARKAMLGLAMIDPNHLGPFVVKGASTDMQAMAREVLGELNYATRPKQKMQRT
jgi:hypothetical protein